ncbi:MAG: adenylate/guanylate cyclase domain-containing protein [Candidatus Muiribacteriota bacterium]
MDNFYKKRLKLIRKLDIITDVYDNPVHIFQKSIRLLKKYIPLKHAVLCVNDLDNTKKLYFSDDFIRNEQNLYSNFLLINKRKTVQSDRFCVLIRPLKLLSSFKHGIIREKFGKIIFFLESSCSFEERIIIRDFLDFINDSIFMLGKIGKIRNLFSKYIPNEVINSMETSQDLNSMMKGTLSDITVLFTDIRGFTSFSEKTSPEKVLELLNQVFEHSVSSIFNNKGMVDKFIGDAVMGVFGAPVYYEKSYINAINAAISIQKNIRPLTEKYPELGIGIGLNYGKAICGNIGTTERMEYTAIGDTVNVASRLEGIARAGEIVITSELNELVKNIFKTEFIGEFSLKGKSSLQKIYSITISNVSDTV